MDLVWKCLEKLDKSRLPSQGMIDLLLDLSTKTSTTSIFPVIDEQLLHQLTLYLRGDEQHNFVGGSNIELMEKLQTKYPVITNTIVSLTNRDGKLEKPVANLFLAIVKHAISVFQSAIKRNSSDYYDREHDEIDSQVFPLFHMKRERANYHKTCKQQDKSAWKNLCEKTFPKHKNLTPGLFVLTCACPRKIVYGFSMMLSGESPEIMFDIIMTRFRKDYNPNIIYDASCKLKEYGLNRELARFLQIQITTDKFHEPNHTTCTEAFKSSKYDDLKDANTEAAEQVNACLRRIGKSTTFMNPKLFMRSLTIFMAYHNLKSNKRKLN